MTKQVSKALHETGAKRGKNTKETGYCAELHYGTVLETSSFLSLATTKLNRKLGRNLLPWTVPRCNSRQGRPSLNRNSLRLSTDNFHIDHNAPLYPPNFCLTIVSSFSWVLQSSQEKSKAMVMKSFGGVNKVHYGLCENGENIMQNRSFVYLSLFLLFFMTAGREGSETCW